MVVAGVERADVYGRRDERPGTGTDGDGSTASANTRVSLAARDSRRRSLRPGVGQGDRGSRRYRVRPGFGNVRLWPLATCPFALHMSALGGKADMRWCGA